jgi:hypothetical protein
LAVLPLDNVSDDPGEDYFAEGMTDSSGYLAARTLSGEDESVVGELREAYTRNKLQGFRQKQLQLALARWTGWLVDAFQIASYYARLDHSTPALAWLERHSKLDLEC